MTTIVEHLQEVIDRCNKELTATMSGQAGREFSLARTAAEEAQMRFTRGMAFLQTGKVTITDLEKPDPRSP